VNPEQLSEEVLSAYLDGECTDAERRAVDARLETDAEWRALLDEVRGTRDALRSLPRREPPPGFLDGLVETHAVSSRAHRTRRPRVLAGLAAAAAIAVAFLVATPSGSDNDVAPPIASLADSHGATVSLQSDPLSGLVPIAANSGTEP
jgi:anti-sigma factor RsiW